MPTYEYACTECGHHFEQAQSFYDDPLEHCPVCNGRLRKVFNAVGVVFKGSGFYHTDSRAGSGSSGSSKAGSSGSSGSGSGSSGSGSSGSGSGSSGSGSSGSGSSGSGSGSSGSPASSTSSGS